MINQKELVARVRSNLSYKYKTAELEDIVDAVTAAVLEAVSNGEDASIRGLGKFHARFIKGKKISKTGIPWLEGKEFTIPSRYHLGFSPSDSANRAVAKLIDKIEDKVEK